MKTAMQEIISTFHLYQNSGCTQEEHELISFYIKCAENLLEKEREQIIEAYDKGVDIGLEAMELTTDYLEAEEYYNKTYNQNK